MEEKRQTKKAVALKYDTNIHTAPQVIAKGKGIVAQKIIESAQANGVPLYQDTSLANILVELELLEEIPEELYRIVAEVFTFIYQLDRKWQK